MTITDDDLKRGIRAWANRLHIPMTRAMSRALREEIHQATKRREGEMTMKKETTVQDAQSRLQVALAASSVYSLRERAQIAYAVTAIVDAVLADNDRKRKPPEVVGIEARAVSFRQQIPPHLMGEEIPMPYGYRWSADRPKSLTLEFEADIPDGRASLIFSGLQAALRAVTGPAPFDPPAPVRPSPAVIVTAPAYNSPAWWDARPSGSYAPSRLHHGCGWVKRPDGKWNWRYLDGTYPNPPKDRPGNHWDGNIYPPGHRAHPDYAHLFTQA